MKKNLLARLLATLFGAGLMTVHTDASALTVGDPAPKLQVGGWAQGDPVKEFESGKAYIVEFWATWCGPCRATIPHLNELHTKFKDKGLIVIGQNVWERDESLVAPFIKKMAANMTYRVALDDKSKSKDGAMATTWMKAAGQNGIPAAFIVDKKGKIAWIGHPATLKDGLLEDILADRYDAKKGDSKPAGTDAAKPADKQKAAAPLPAPMTKHHQLLALNKTLAASLRSQNWDEAETTVAEMEKLAPEKLRPRYTLERFHVLSGRKDFAGACKLLGQLSDAHPEDGWLQNQIAWLLATKPGLENRDLALAEKAAERAVKATDGKYANALDTLARVQFLNGRTPDAITTQQKAVDAADSHAKAGLRMSLASYQAGKLPDEKN